MHMHENGCLEEQMSCKSRSALEVQREMGRTTDPGKLERILQRKWLLS